MCKQKKAKLCACVRSTPRPCGVSGDLVVGVANSEFSFAVKAFNLSWPIISSHVHPCIVCNAVLKVESYVHL